MWVLHLVHFLAVPCKQQCQMIKIIIGFVKNGTVMMVNFLFPFQLESRHYKFSPWTIQSNQTNSTSRKNC